MSDISRGGAGVARRAHNPKVVGSNPAPATSRVPRHAFSRVEAFFFCKLYSRDVNTL